MSIILMTIGGILLFIILVVVLRAFLLKPTEAKTVKFELDTSERAIEYGKQFARILQKETISSRYDSDRTKFLEFHELLEDMFPNVHRVCEKHVFDGSLLYKWTGKSDKDPILLMSHHDVVEATGTWEHEPFSGDIDKEGRVWGRGAVDTKASLFCIFSAVDELIRDGYQPECDVYLASSCTEEWSGDGAPRTAQYLKERGIRLSLVLDEGGMIIENPLLGVEGLYGMVGVVEKGYGDLKFTAHGKGGHASAPGKNTPLIRLGKFMTSIEKKNPFQAQMTPTVKEMFRRIAPNMNFGMKLIFANMWLFEPLLVKLLPSISPQAGAMIRTTMAFTMAKGSQGYNVLPEEAYVCANMRYIQHQANVESIALVSELAKKYDLETEVIYQDAPCPIVDYKSKAFQLIEEVASEVYPGVGICPYVMTGGTDAKYYREVSDSCIRFAPLYITKQQLSSVHALNENIYQGALPKGVDFYKRVIQKS